MHVLAPPPDGADAGGGDPQHFLVPRLRPRPAVVARTLAQRCDPALAFADELTLRWLPAASRRSPGRYSHSDTTLYILLVILHTKYTGRRQNDSNVHA